MAVAHDSESNEIFVLTKNENNPLEILPVVIKTVTSGSSGSSSGSSSEDKGLSLSL